MSETLPNVAERFGTLLKRYITMRGWTYEQTGFKVWNSDARKAHVSGYVNGKKGVPSPQTIKKFREALEIPQEEIDACFGTAPVPSMREGLLDELRLSDNTLKTLAWEFGHQNPRASAGEYEQFLRDKATEMESLQTELEALKAEDANTSNRIAEAEAALEDGDFASAEDILGDLRELSQERSLEAVTKTARIAAAQGRAALLRNDADTAHTHFAAAADMVGGVEPLAGAELRNTYEDHLHQHGLRYGGSGLACSEALLRRNLDIYTQDQHPIQWAMTLNNLGIALQSQGQRTQGQQGADLFAQAVKAFQDALTVTTKDQHPIQWAGTLNNLGNALQRQGERTQGQQGADLFAQAVEAYQDALTVRTKDQHPIQWATTLNNLGNALQRQGERTQGQQGADLFAQAVEAYQDALTVRTKDQHPIQWATTLNNLGNALKNQGQRTQGQQGADLFAQAVKAYQDALTVRTKDQHPIQWAMTLNNLGNALKNQGQRTQGQQGADLFAQAVKAYQDALTVRTKDQHPLDWAMTQENIGIAFVSMAERAADGGRDDLHRALAAFDAALTVYDPVHTGYYFEKCSRAREIAAEALAALED